MSQFLPEQMQQPQDAGAVVIAANPETNADDVALMQRVFAAAVRNPNQIPTDFMAYLIDFIQTSRLSIPIGQVFGFTQFTAQYETVGGTETTASVPYTDLATVGPELSLSDGVYLILWGGFVSCTAANGAFIGLSINGAVEEPEFALSTSNTGESIAVAAVKTMRDGNSNTVKLRYRVGAGTGSYQLRWLAALKVSN